MPGKWPGRYAGPPPVAMPGKWLGRYAEPPPVAMPGKWFRSTPRGDEVILAPLIGPLNHLLGVPYSFVPLVGL